ncbi:MAG: hypothetical protein ACLFUC_02490 [Bacteroidales bacterium]
MKDTIITGSQKKRELIIWLTCLGVAFILNILGIIIYKTSWTEIFTSIHIVLLLSGILYSLVLIIRVFAFLVSRIFSSGA